MLCCCVRSSSSRSSSSSPSPNPSSNPSGFRGCTRLKDVALIATCLISFIAAFAVAMTTIAHSGARNLAASVSILGSIILVPPIVVSLCISRFFSTTTQASLEDEENSAAHEFLELEQLRWTEFQEFGVRDSVISGEGSVPGRRTFHGYLRLGGGMQEVMIFKLKLVQNPEVEELRQEVVSLGSLRKCNVLPMLGFTLDDKQLLLFLPRLRSLREALQSSGLSWSCRCRVAALTARGVARLHHDGTPIIHGSISCQSVHLLEDGDDSSCTPYISETGLLKLSSMPAFQAGAETSEANKSWHSPPENGAPTMKSDVYNFGVLLYVLLSGETEVQPGFNPSSALKHKLSRLMDPKLEKLYSKSQAEIIQQVALKCVERDPIRRPDMIRAEAMLRPLLAMAPRS